MGAMGDVMGGIFGAVAGLPVRWRAGRRFPRSSSHLRNGQNLAPKVGQLVASAADKELGAQRAGMRKTTAQTKTRQLAKKPTPAIAAAMSPEPLSSELR